MPAAEPKPGRFRSKYDPLTLVQSVVPDIARTAAGPEDDPVTVSQRAYDRARVRSRFPDAPGADATSRRLGLPWPELLRTVLTPARSASQTLGAARRREARAAIPVAEAVAAVRLIASALEADADLDPATYDRLRGELVESDQQAWLHGGDLDELLATSDQIRLACATESDPEGWLTALSAAGLARRTAPAAGVPVVEALEWFMCDAGWLPSGRRQLAAYARARGFALHYTHKGISTELQQLRANRAARGLWTPGRAPRAGRRPAFDVEPLDRPDRAAPNLGLTYDRIVDALLWAIEDLGTARPLTQDAYQAWSSRRPHAPSMSTVQRVASRWGKSFAQARTDALARRASGRAAAARPGAVRLDFYDVGETVIAVVPRRRAPVGRPRKYASDEQRRAAQREMRRQRRAARAAERARLTEERRRQHEHEKEQRRIERARVPQRRRQYRRADGQKIEWPDLVAAGLVAVDTPLFATLRGRRYTARFNGTGFDVDGYGTSATLSGAASLIVNGPRDGWEFWRVGEGRGVTVKQLRSRLSVTGPTGRE